MDNLPNNENQYIQYCDEMKEQFNELKEENKGLKKELYFIKKELCSTYGISRIIDYMADDLHNIPILLLDLIQRQRGSLSTLFEKYIIKYEDEDEKEEQEELEIIVRMNFED